MLYPNSHQVFFTFFSRVFFANISIISYCFLLAKFYQTIRRCKASLSFISFASSREHSSKSVKNKMGNWFVKISFGKKKKTTVGQYNASWRLISCWLKLVCEEKERMKLIERSYYWKNFFSVEFILWWTIDYVKFWKMHFLYLPCFLLITIYF